MPEPPKFPAGEYVAPKSIDADARAGFIEQLAAAPGLVREAASGLDDAALNTKYRNWTIRQIVHHLADSHMNCHVRFHWALTEDAPLIKAYDQTAWGNLPDARTAPIEVSLTLLDGLHARWVHLLRGMSEADFARVYNHPETGEAVLLAAAVPLYAWHSGHHTKQIHWVRENRL